MIALTHLPSPALERGQRTHLDRAPIDFPKALQQHADYCRALRECGVEVRILDANHHLPDSVFVEDTAIVLEEIAILASMGTASRREELPAIETELKKYRPTVRIQLPATIEGGDVLRVDQKIIVGLSRRTNAAGIDELKSIVRQFDYEIISVAVGDCLHLKTGCSALPDGSLLVNEAWVAAESLRDFHLIRIPPTEPWAANVLSIGGDVVTPAGHPATTKLIREMGFRVRPVDLSEFAKAEGGATCLSILLNEPRATE